MHSITTLLVAALSFSLLASAHPNHGDGDLIEPRKGKAPASTGTAALTQGGHGPKGSHNASFAEDHVPVFKAPSCNCAPAVCPSFMDAKSVS